MFYPIVRSEHIIAIKLGAADQTHDITLVGDTIKRRLNANIYRSGNRLVNINIGCYATVHNMTLHDVQYLALRNFVFINPNGKPHTNAPFSFIRTVYQYLVDTTVPIEAHPDYPTHPAWKPNLTKRQIDAILAKQHVITKLQRETQRKEGAK